MWKHLVIIASVVCLHTSLAGALSIISAGAGTGHISDPATSSPGTSFVLDYTHLMTGETEPYQAVGFALSFTCYTYTTLNIQLNSSPTIHQFPPAPSDYQTYQTVVVLYDPDYMTGEGDAPSYIMPDDWKAELDDGLLQGRFWVEGSIFEGMPFTPQDAYMQGQAWYLVPEPATLALLSLGFLALRRRR